MFFNSKLMILSVQKDIIKILGGKDWAVFSGNSDRFNLFYKVEYLPEDKIFDSILKYIQSDKPTTPPSRKCGIMSAICIQIY